MFFSTILMTFMRTRQHHTVRASVSSLRVPAKHLPEVIHCEVTVFGLSPFWVRHTVIERSAMPLKSITRVEKKRKPAISWPSLGLMGWMCVRRNRVAAINPKTNTWMTFILYSTRLRLKSTNSLRIKAFKRPSTAGREWCHTSHAANTHLTGVETSQIMSRVVGIVHMGLHLGLAIGIPT